ncbi:MAG: phosphate ABC transporter substrate-binding protein [Alphaproteobacteria bacterium]|nr:phosphate ABC transporter substrate-binding protein [Alphaproteobacteria bacterium]
MWRALIGAGVAAISGMIVVGVAGSAEARDELRIVGSSTVFPFATTVAEEFGRAGEFKTPVVESTGTGGGLKFFCEGAGVDSPDIANASRRIKKSEVEACAKNGVVDIHEVKIGFDGIVLAHAKGATPVKFTLAQIWQALAKDVIVDGKIVPNPYKMWSEIDGSLPATKIEVIGPPPTSGTRDAFNELAMEGGCKTFPEAEALKKEDEKKYKALCQSVREDGAYIEAGENDNLIVQKIEANDKAYGVFGYSFLDQNRDKLVAVLIDDTEPSYENISSGAYSVSRALYFYVKKAHIGVIPGLKEYVDLWTLESTFGPESFLADKGLIALPDDQREAQRASSAAMENLILDK